MVNRTTIDGFMLLGLTDIRELQIFLFSTFLIFYLFSLLGNITIVTLIINNNILHKPMYFFLCNLSFLDMVISTTTVPKMLSGLLIGDKKISMFGCAAQLYFFHFFGCTEALLLTAMSYDRYVAICHPLEYHILMGRTMCCQLAITCWITGFIYSLSETIIIFRLPYCNIRQVNHFYCDMKPVLKLACGDIHLSKILVLIVFSFIAVSSLPFVSVSYMLIGRHLLKIRSARERRKSFLVCSSHIIVVSLYMVTAILIYLGPNTDDSLAQDRIGAVLFNAITPTLNPLIYTLRNAEIKNAVKKIFQRNQKAYK
ncbi:olfactory receptor 12D1-like [Pyxicephalus adspersus]|uniref:Olfactory receptor n=1 Tax=Pyxicephalus adspersus TaxID=30357 RepID=A0AAV2ZHA3_PYXAD|nr:TPA: hypothetical protein GDO54_005202 [Pyxicephalus adspersus]